MKLTKHRAQTHRVGEQPDGKPPLNCDSSPTSHHASLFARLLRQLLVLLLLLFLPPPTSAQEASGHVRARRASARGEEVAPGEVIRVDTDLVPVEVIVRDAAGQIVRGLRSTDFRLFEDGVERPISFFNAETTGGEARCPLDLVLALDVSGSMTRGEMEMLRRAAALFTERLSGPRSRFAVVSFGMNVKVLQPLTDNRRKLDKAFASATRDELGLSTHAYDAVDDAVRLLVKRARRAAGELAVKRAVVVISDGFPTGDTVSPQTVIERANAADVTVYTVTMPSFSSGYTVSYGRPLPTILDVSGLTEETGGVNVYATDRNYTEALQTISREVLSRYVLAFYPAGGKHRDGNFHQLLIRAPDGLSVNQSRRGYAGKGEP
ncbi:MAG: VWA domain-containing protein [Pyrinomonadaceae bacterium]